MAADGCPDTRLRRPPQRKKLSRSLARAETARPCRCSARNCHLSTRCKRGKNLDVIKPGPLEPPQRPQHVVDQIPGVLEPAAQSYEIGRHRVVVLAPPLRERLDAAEARCLPRAGVVGADPAAAPPRPMAASPRPRSRPRGARTAAKSSSSPGSAFAAASERHSSAKTPPKRSIWRAATAWSALDSSPG